MIPTHDQAAHQAWYDAIRPREAIGRRVTIPEDVLAVLWAAGLHDVAPCDVLAFEFSQRRWALLSARVDREVYGHPNLAIVHARHLGWVTVTDLRPALARMLAGERR
jgi:hypothetical protein